MPDCINKEIMTKMKSLLSILLLLSISSFSFAQQIPLKGVVTVHNSKTNTGKFIYVPDAQVEHPTAKPDITDSEGQFTLNIVGLPNGVQTNISVIPYGAFKDYVVVGDLDFTLGRKEPATISIRKAGEAELWKQNAITKNMQKDEQELNRLQKQIDQLQKENARNTKEYKELRDSLRLANENYDEKLERLTQIAEKLSIENLDFRNETYVQAFNCLERGELDSVFYYLKDEQIEAEYEEAIKQIEVGTKEIEIAKKEEEIAQSKIASGQQKREEAIQSWLLLARTAEMKRDYDKTTRYYELAINADLLNFENIFEYAGYLGYIREYSKAEFYYHQLLDKYEPSAVENPKEYNSNLVSILNNIGSNYISQNEYVKAEKYLLQSLDIYESLAAENPKVYNLNLAGILNNLGLNYMSQNEYAKAEVYYLRCLKIREVLASENPEVYNPELARILNNIGANYMSQNKYAEAEEYFLQSLKIKEALASENPKVYNPDLAEMLNNLGLNYMSQNEYAKAEVYFLQCLTIKETLAVENPKIYNPNLAMTLNNIGTNYISQNEYAKAEKYFLQSLKIKEALAAENPKVYNPDLALTLKNLGLNYDEQNNPIRAGIYYRRCLEIYEELAAENPETYNPNLADVLNSQANNYSSQASYIKAEEYYLRCLEIYEELALKNIEAYNRDLADILGDVAINYYCQTNYIKAEEYYLRSMKIREKPPLNDPENIINHIYASGYIAVNYFAQKKYALAVKYMNQHIDLIQNNRGLINDCDNLLLEAYSKLSIYCIFTKNYIQSEQSARKVLKIDHSQTWIKELLATSLLFQGKYKIAEPLFVELKNSSFGEACLNDFLILEEEDLIPKNRKADVEKIRALLSNK